MGRRSMTPVALEETMSAAQKQGWLVLLELTEVFRTGRCLVGGQMVWLLAAEHGCPPPRATDDIDMVVDIRSEPTGVHDLCLWLETERFNLDGISPQGIGHRYVREADPGPGRVLFDVLAPDNVGRRADLSTTHGARTIEAAGATRAMKNSERIKISVTGVVGWISRPTLPAAIVLKAAATTVPTRFATEPDFADAAFLLSLVQDPMAAADTLSNGDRKQLRAISPLLDDKHAAWRALGRERTRLGLTSLAVMLDANHTSKL
jgi:hypothetical protein